MNVISLFLLLFFSVSSCNSTPQQEEETTIQTTNPTTIVGAAQFDNYLPLLRNKRVGVVVNQTSVVGQDHLVDHLLNMGVDVKKVFAPEHGFRGTADAEKQSLTASTAKQGYLLSLSMEKTRSLLRLS